MPQIDTLNSAVADLQASASSLQGRVAALEAQQSPDLTSAIAGVQSVKSTLDSLAVPAPTPTPTPTPAPVDTTNTSTVTSPIAGS